MITITTNLADLELTARQAKELSTYLTDHMSEAMEYVGISTTETIKRYYADLGKAHWEQPNSPTHGAGRKSTRWAEGLKTNWTPTTSTATGSGGGAIEIGYAPSASANARMSPGSFRAKVYGADITPKTARALTIPINPLAHGHTVRELANILDSPIFAPPDGSGGTKDYLAAIIDGQLTPLYLLRTSVHQDPWPNALPPDDTLTASANRALLEWLTMQ
jgi:hypothetical protein